MTKYIVVCDTERHAGNLFNSLVAHMRRNNLIFRALRTDKRIQSIEETGYQIRFMGEQRYYDVGQYGFHGKVIWDTMVEKYLDGSAPRHILIK